ncbi:hypothetical protein HanRHA438_Chr09g0396771 [Helianthus annuus]|nr:hypothetical protein HanRHA438_Chr09g0396771 [Helianthus annuus]
MMTGNLPSSSKNAYSRPLGSSLSSSGGGSSRDRLFSSLLTSMAEKDYLRAISSSTNSSSSSSSVSGCSASSSIKGSSS